MAAISVTAYGIPVGETFYSPGRLGTPLDITVEDSTDYVVYTAPLDIKYAIVNLNILNRDTASIYGASVAISTSASPNDQEFIQWKTGVNPRGVLELTNLIISAGQKLVVRFPPAPVVSVYILSANPANEGSGVTVNLLTTNVANGTSVPYSISGSTITLADFTGLSTLSGAFTVNNNSASQTFTLANDATTEGDEIFNVALTGPGSGATLPVTVYDTSLSPSFTSVPTSINEGNPGTFTVGNVTASGTYYWTILNNSTDNTDFEAVSGSFIVSGGTGSFTVTPTLDWNTEGSQNFRVELRQNSISGTVLATSALVTIVDTSTYPSITRFAPSPNETGNNVNLQFTYIPAGTYYWSINSSQGAGTSTAADFSPSSGSFTVTGFYSNTNVTLYPLTDYLTEGGEIYYVDFRYNSSSGPVAFTFSDYLTDSSFDPSLTYVGGTTLNELASKQINVSASTPPGGVWYWTILHGTTTAADFLATSGSFSGSGGAGLFVVRAINDGLSESNETFQVEFRTGSTSGPVAFTSAVLTIGANAT